MATDRRIPSNQRFLLHCKDCEILLAEFEQTTDQQIVMRIIVDQFAIRPPDSGVQIDGSVFGVCPACGGETEFPSKYLPL